MKLASFTDIKKNSMSVKQKTYKKEKPKLRAVSAPK